MRFLKKRRREKTRAQLFPSAHAETLRERVPLYWRLPETDRAELHGHIQIILDEKRFEGCGGLAITDDIRLTIAAQAVVLLLHRETDYFPDLSSILVYPSTYFAPVVDAENGIVTEFEEERAGETWDRGSLVLSWDSVSGSVSGASPLGPDVSARDKPRAAIPHEGVDEDVELVPAYNVVLHEFAHQLDLENGEIDGIPGLPSREVRERWIRVMQAAFEQLQRQYERGEDAVIDDYALEGPAEFFAVTTESFFETPFALNEEYPDLYDILRAYYRQNPVEW